MIEEIKNFLEKYDELTKLRFNILYDLIHDSVSQSIKEKLWAKLPSFYVNNNFVRFIPFKEHINIEAKAVLNHKEQLFEYKISPKGMLKIYHNQKIPLETLKLIFTESLE